MGRRKRSAYLTQQLAYAKARETYVTPPPAVGTAVKPRPKAQHGYGQILTSVTPQPVYEVLASTAAVAFFGGESALGLVPFSATHPRAPRHLKPAMIHATIGAGTTVSYVTAKASGRRYAKYTAAPSAGAQVSYSAPISAADVPSLLTKVQSLLTAKQSSVGGQYGRIYFTMEYDLISENGHA